MNNCVDALMCKVAETPGGVVVGRKG